MPERPHKRVAWANRKYRGGSPRDAPRLPKYLKLADEGLQRTEIAERLDIGVASVYRVLADAKKHAGDQAAA